MAMTISEPPVAGESRAKRLKDSTHDLHEKVNRSITSADSFANLKRYARFLSIQYLFHQDVHALYVNAQLQALLPALESRRRLPLVEADLADLALDPPQDECPVFVPEGAVDIPTALGWLYVVEGSNMGAVTLRKEAGRLGLSDAHGARHMAPAPEGPAPHWRTFTAALNAVALTAEEETRAVAGAQSAFLRMQSFVDARLG